VVDVDYVAAYLTPLGPRNWQTVAYCDLILFEPVQSNSAVTLSGDSGSLVFTPDPGSVINPVVGLLAWGADNGSYGVACKIQNVFEELRVDVLCAGGFEAFLDALAEDGQDFDATLAASLFEPKRPKPGRTFRLHNGLAREVQQRLRGSQTGRYIVDLVDRHRAELLSLLLRNGNVRRSAVGALRPILRGAITSDRVFAHILDKKDLARIELAIDEVMKSGSQSLATDIRKLRKRLNLKSRLNESVQAIIED
jgi:hypothetical protein